MQIKFFNLRRKQRKNELLTAHSRPESTDIIYLAVKNYPSRNFTMCESRKWRRDENQSRFRWINDFRWILHAFRIGKKCYVRNVNNWNYTADGGQVLSSVGSLANISRHLGFLYFFRCLYLLFKFQVVSGGFRSPLVLGFSQKPFYIVGKSAISKIDSIVSL